LGRVLRRTASDGEMIDVVLSAKTADYVSEHLDRWMEPERVHTPLIFEPGHALIRRDPLGVTLIIGAWNEPLVTVFAPVAAAFGAGNVVGVKPSEVSAACSAAVGKLVPKYFDPKAGPVFEGGGPDTPAL